MPNVCNSGKQQSPINIKTSKTQECSSHCELLFYYRSSVCTIQNNSGNIVLDYDSGSYVIYNSIVYELDKISFSLPSSNKIDNSNYPMEMYLFHKSTDIGKVLIVSVFLDVNDASSKSKAFFDMLSSDLPKISGSEKYYNTPEDWNVFNALPEIKAFYTYNGSLVQHPCTENVTWIVMDTPTNIGTGSYRNLKSIIGKNSRHTQKLNNRVVYYNPNSSGKASRNYGSKLRCYTDTELRQACKCMCKDGQTVATFPNINGTLLFVVCLLLLITLVIYIAIQKGLFSLKPLKDFIRHQPKVLMLQPKGTLVPEGADQSGGALGVIASAISAWV